MNVQDKTYLILHLVLSISIMIFKSEQQNFNMKFL